MTHSHFERSDGTRYSLAGYRYVKPSTNAKTYSPKSSKQNLPTKIDLRKLLTPIDDQGQTNSCVAHAVAGAYEYLAKQHLEQDYDVSRLYIYYNARYLDSNEDDEIDDNGSYIQKAIEGLQEYGACSEEMYPFDIDTVNDEPYQEAYDEGSNFLVEDTQLIPTDLMVWKNCLAEGHPIIFALSLFRSFDQHTKKGLVPNPTENETNRGHHGLHAMLAIGYSDKDQRFIVRNSWGKDWGDNGYCYIPYSYLINEKYNQGDSWIIKQINNVELDSDTYSYDEEESVVGDYDTELSEMSEEEYAEMIDAMGEYLLEYRIALLFLYAAGADGDVSDDEYDTLGEYMEDILYKLDSTLKPSKVLKHAIKDIENEELIEETIALFGEYFSYDFLFNLLTQIEEVTTVDELSDDENDIITYLMEAWEISEDDYYSDEEE